MCLITEMFENPSSFWVSETHTSLDFRHVLLCFRKLGFQDNLDFEMPISETRHVIVFQVKQEEGAGVFDGAEPMEVVQEEGQENDQEWTSLKPVFCWRCLSETEILNQFLWLIVKPV